MQRQVEVFWWNLDSKCLHRGGYTHRSCLKKIPAWVKNTLGSCLLLALIPIWKKLNKEVRRKKAEVNSSWLQSQLLGTKSQYLFGDKTSNHRGLSWRGGSKEGRIWASAAWLKATGTSLNSEGCKPVPCEEAGRTGMAVLKESTTCYYKRQLSLRKGHIQQAELHCGITWRTVHCPLHPGKQSVHQSVLPTQSPPRKQF